jgi:hypothetical protein
MHALVTSSRSLKIIGVLDHLVLRSCIALLCWMWPLLELLLDNGCGRVDLVVGSQIHYRCRSKKLTCIMAFKGKVTSLSIVSHVLLVGADC